MSRSVIVLGLTIWAAVAAAQTAPPLPSMQSTGGVGAVTETQKAELTAADKVAIARAVKKSGRAVKAPAGVTATVGAELPPALELYMLPDDVLATIPAAKLYKYTVIDTQAVLVDPTTMRVVDILSE